MTPHREIERKFLLKTIPDLSKLTRYSIEQGYVMATPDGRQVRLRRTPTSCILACKSAEGIVRDEREIEITPQQFEVLWPTTIGKRLTKTRHILPWTDYTIEIDVYGGINHGIVVAEVEFGDEKECAEFHPPDWFGDEVTNNPRYSNVVLARE